MLCAFCPPTNWATSLGYCRNCPDLSTDKMYRACMRVKDQTLEKIRSLHSFENMLKFCLQEISGREVAGR